MSETLDRIRQLVRQGAVRVSDHGDEELDDDVIDAGDAAAGLDDAQPVEDYPAAAPAYWCLQRIAKDDRYTLCGASSATTLKVGPC